MVMAEQITFHTAESVRERMGQAPTHWPRYETVFGELLVTPAPAPAHQAVVSRLLFALATYLEREPGVGGFAMTAPADISWGRRDVLVQPDVFVIPAPESFQFRWAAVTRLFLAAEVVSPGSQHADHFTKRHLYQEEHTGLYWALDPEKGTADAWESSDIRPHPEPERLLWHPTGAATPFVLPLADLYRGMYPPS
jgi:Uma2 family endonuclease